MASIAWAALETQDATDFLIELGGEILARELMFRKKQQVVGIESADSNWITEAIHIVELLDIAMASSGNYRKVRIDSHYGKSTFLTINPAHPDWQNKWYNQCDGTGKTCGLADALCHYIYGNGFKKKKKIKGTALGLVGEAYLTYWDEITSHRYLLTEGFRKRILE